MTDIFDLTGRVALVTGASRGIGEEIAKVLARHGAHVMVSSRKLDGCERVAAAIRDTGGSAEAIACHVGSMEDISSTFLHIRSTHGRLDILVNNAATNPFYGHILDTDLGTFQKTIDVNIRGFFFMSVEAGKLMQEQGSGVIVNTSSINALKPGDKQAVYSMTKAAIVNMTKAFAKECANSGIRCNALLPGFTKTRFAGALVDDEATYNHLVGLTPMGRYAEPAEMAGTVLYLASDASSYTTGECIVVDGGYTI